MVRSNRSGVFYVDAQLVFALEDIRFLEDQDNTSLDCFVRLRFAGMNVTSDPFPPVELQLFPFLFSTMSVQSFSQSAASGFLVSHPSLAMNTLGCVAFDSDLIADAFGSGWFAINASQSFTHRTFAIQRTFQVTVMPVNDAPFFTFKCTDDTFGVE
eukprot:3478331-Rhodomonas_salina.1